MNEYLVFCNFEKNSLEMTLKGYLEEGFKTVLDTKKYYAISREEEPADEKTLKALLKIVCRELEKHSDGKAVCYDAGPIINKHVARLTENEMKSLKFHDPFLDDVKVMVSRIILERNKESG